MPTNDNDTKQENNNNIIRNLDYLADLTDGVRFTAIPDRVTRAFIDNEMPVSKYKLLCVMLTHSRNFQIWSTYLRKRFDQRTLKKYVAELTDEGYIRVERVTTSNNRTANVYHVNSIHEWSIYKDAASSPPRVVAHGVQEHGVQEHGLRISTGKENNRKIDKPSIYQGNTMSNKVGVNVTPATSMPEAAGSKFDSAAGSKFDPAAGSKFDPDNTERNIEKRKIDKTSSIYQDDTPKKPSKLSDHEFVKELKSNRQEKASRLQKLRDDIHALEKKMAAHEQGAVPREVFIEYLPKNVSIEPTLREQISKGLSGFGLAGDSTDWKKALHMAYKLQAGLGLEGYKRIVKKLRQIKQGDITAQDFANLRADGFEEKYGKPLYEFLIMG